MKVGSRMMALLVACVIAVHPVDARASSKQAPAPNPAASTASKLANDGWPETREGAIGRHWLTAFNTGEAAMKEFYLQEFSPDSLARRGPEQRLTRYRDSREKFGTLAFGAVKKELPGELTVSLLDADGAPHEFVFAVETAPPFKLKQVSLREYREMGHGGFGGFHH